MSYIFNKVAECLEKTSLTSKPEDDSTIKDGFTNVQTTTLTTVETPEEKIKELDVWTDTEIPLADEYTNGAELSNYFKGYDHITFYVGSANVAATHFINTFGFVPYAHLGLESGSRLINARVVKNGNVIIQFMSALLPPQQNGGISSSIADEIHFHLQEHGDAVKDVAFEVTDVEQVYSKAIKSGKVKAVWDPVTYKDEFGSITIARISTIGDTIHTLIDRSRYRGFLPGGYVYDEVTGSNMQLDHAVSMDSIDHCVQNVDWGKMDESCSIYSEAFGFHKFWSVDDKQVYTQYSALKSTVMASPDGSIKMPINEPAKGLKTSQIEEFLKFNGGPGIQHIAIKVDDILKTVETMKYRGVDFIDVPEKYYDNLEKRLAGSTHPDFKESMQRIRKLGILVDYDEGGYLLQLFTRPLFDRPTVFLEIIQRNNHQGFGAGNFKGLFEILEEDQKKRGNLTDQVDEMETDEVESTQSSRGRSRATSI